PSRTESLSRGIIEAGMAGLPCVGANVGGIPEVIEHNKTGFLFESENYEELASILFSLIQNSGLRNKMGCESKKFMEKYFINEKKTKEYTDLLKKIYLNEKNTN